MDQKFRTRMVSGWGAHLLVVLLLLLRILLGLVQSFDFRFSGLGIQDSGSRIRISGFGLGIKDSGFGMEDSEFGFRVKVEGLQQANAAAASHLPRLLLLQMSLFDTLV